MFEIIVKKGERKLLVRLPLGKVAFGAINTELNSIVKELDNWKDISLSASSA